MYILTWTCASRQNGVHFFDILTSKSGLKLKCFVHFDLEMCNGVQFFISHLASWLRTGRFREPTFRPSGASNHWKNTVFRNFPTFSPESSFFFLLTLSLSLSLLFSSLLVSSRLFSFLLSSLLWLFPSLLFICPYCRKFDF